MVFRLLTVLFAVLSVLSVSSLQLLAMAQDPIDPSNCGSDLSKIPSKGFRAFLRRQIENGEMVVDSDGRWATTGKGVQVEAQRRIETASITALTARAAHFKEELRQQLVQKMGEDPAVKAMIRQLRTAGESEQLEIAKAILDKLPLKDEFVQMSHLPIQISDRSPFDVHLDAELSALNYGLSLLRDQIIVIGKSISLP